MAALANRPANSASLSVSVCARIPAATGSTASVAGCSGAAALALLLPVVSLPKSAAHGMNRRAPLPAGEEDSKSLGLGLLLGMCSNKEAAAGEGQHLSTHVAHGLTLV